MSSKAHPSLGSAELPQESVVFVLDDGTRVEGNVTVPRRGARLSDFISASDRDFFTVAKARIVQTDGKIEDVAFMMIARRFVKMVRPGPTPDDAPAA